jgi:hypothetical protein
MIFLTSIVPTWVSVLFLPAFVGVIFWIAAAARKAALSVGLPLQQRTRLWWRIVGFGILYYAYTSTLSWLGVFSALVVPPPIFFFTALPLLAFLLGIVYRSRMLGMLLRAATLGSLVRLHVFRLVGVFFFINLYYEALPQRFAVLAGTGDILTALLAIWVAREADSRTPNHRRLVLGWNLLGLTDIVAVQGDAEALRLINIGDMPYCLIPAVAPALIIFLHLLIFRKLAIGSVPSGQSPAILSELR